MRQAFLKKVIESFGEESQRKKAIEECAELAAELAKEINGKGSVDKVIDEIADVLIMSQQLKLMYGKTKVDKRIRFKIARLKERVEVNNNATSRRRL